MEFYSEVTRNSKLTRQFDYSYLTKRPWRDIYMHFPFCEVHGGSRCLFKIKVTTVIA